ncbi:Neuropilin-2 [Stylophora pistillata]|uniref:Neuropilin-2 n=1 Tax=Stylophora pistillata TaxID=50429 RepID=A0A2B4SVQ1_STYPI|nr:Neuropilin-2 [Stylophora pistillata]
MGTNTTVCSNIFNEELRMLLWKALSLITLLNSFLSAASAPAPAIDVYIKSEGYYDRGKTPNTRGIAYVKVNGEDYSRHGRGHNVVVVDGATGVVLSSKVFDTNGKSNAGNDLRDYLNSIKGNKIVLVAVQEGGWRFSSSAVRALKRLGASGSVRGSYRSSFAFAGYAGTRQSTWVTQKENARYLGPSEITLKIPLSSRDYKCQNQTLPGDKGVIYSPNYPERYPDGQYCMWKIMLNASYQVALMFTHFSLQSENNTDAVYVYDGTNQTGKELGVFYGGQLPPRNGIYSSSNSLLVIFRSDKNGSFYGFQASYNAVKCSGALGMESGAILDAQISASSRMNDNSTPRQARLNFIEQGSKQGGWSSRVNDHKSWLQVDLGGYTTVTGVATQGRNSSILRQWITTYTLHFSYDEVIFQLYKEPNEMSAKVFQGNQDGDTVVYNKLISPITARYIRLLPVTWHNHISLRMELYGCRGCSSPLGMESQVISDSQITASTSASRWYYGSAKSARLNLGGWIAYGATHRQWLQVDLGTYSTVTSVATQGVKLYRYRWYWYQPEFWTTSYNLQYSDDGIAFHFYKEPGKTLPKVFNGNQDYQSVVRNKLKQSIRARYIRFKPYNPNSYNLGMRTEIYGCLDCISPVGMESGLISDGQISASSQLDDNHAPQRARLNTKISGIKQGGWLPLTNDRDQWLQVDLGSYTRVTRVATQGRDGYDQWVTSFELQYSVNEITFTSYKEVVGGNPKMFTGNSDSETAVYNILKPPITTRYIRILPIAWSTSIAMRIEIYGCTVCNRPLGMESGAIKDAQITASTQWDDNHAPQRARLNMKLTGVKRGAWLSRVKDLKQWLQVDLGSYTTVTGVATQGRNGHWPEQWVTKYRLQYSNDGVNFHYYKEKEDNSFKLFDGNQDTDSIVYHKLARQITARYIRFIPVEWRNHISMRLEIYGCEECFTPLGMEDGMIPDIQVSSSSRLDDNHSPSQARLNFKEERNVAGGWSAQLNDKNPWLQVDLGSYTRVTRVATQGMNANDEWVTKYKLQFSDDGKNFQYYKQQGDKKWTVLNGNKGSDIIVENNLKPPVTARFIRFIPTGWHNNISMRTEIYGCPACMTVLGMESQAIEDAQISASSQLDGNHSAIQGRLHLERNGRKQGGWSALTNDRNQWLQVDLNTFARVTVIATQGRHGFKEWVTKYSMQYSDDGVTFTLYKESDSSSEKVFDGNQDSDTVVYNKLTSPITARYIRLIPTTWNNHISMRMELYGCPGCVSPYGMENRKISDSQIKSSSQLDENHSAKHSRLHLKANRGNGGSWSALINDVNQWLQVDLGSYIRVTGIATQGRNGHDEWVTKFRLQYGEDEDVLHFFEDPGDFAARVFKGNTDSDTVVYNALTPPIITRYIRFKPAEWHSRISMRIEIYGCPGCTNPLGMVSGSISDIQITASSQLDGNHSASQARLHFQADGYKVGGWSALTNDSNQWLQVDFGRYTKVTRLATQGMDGYNQWVTKYMLQYSDDGINFHLQKEATSSSPKVFDGNKDQKTVVYNVLSPPITTRYIRLQPVAWNDHISMRMEIYGCPGCAAPLGMDSGAITDAQISASSQWDDNHAARQGRLHYKRVFGTSGSWSSRRNDLNQWFQVDLGQYTTINGIATQGRNHPWIDQYVKAYKLQYSDDGVSFYFYKETPLEAETVFLGNKDRETVVYNEIRQPIRARYIRIRPVDWNQHISIRVEIYGCPGCVAPLGMESKSISDAQISASSQLDDDHAPKQARLHIQAAINGKSGGWSARTNDLYQWLQVDLRSKTIVTRIATQGRDGLDEWVTKYRIQFSYSGINFQFYKKAEHSSAQVFDGNEDSATVVVNKLTDVIRARFIRLLPIEWHKHISMRIEIYGCPDCIAPLGMESGNIADSKIIVSSILDDNSPPSQARLNYKVDGGFGGGWSAHTNNASQFLQVDLGTYTRVTRVATQGRNGYDQWVTKYKVEYGEDGQSFRVYKPSNLSVAKVFTGNQNSDAVVYNSLTPPITTRFIRLIPVEWHNHISMRIEVYGCPGCAAALGMENKEIPDANINVSSQLDADHSAKEARLNSKGGWSALNNNFNQWLQVNIGYNSQVTGVATQGMTGNDQWVSRYRIQYSSDGVTFEFYNSTEDSSAKVFYGNKNGDTVVYNMLRPPITARYIRLIPVEWHNHISMRVEIYGCSVVNDSPAPEMTTEASTVRGAENNGKRKTEGVNIPAVLLPVVLSILIAALGLFYWKRRAQKHVHIKSISFQTGTNELNYAVNRIYDEGADEVVYHDFED